TIAFDRMTLPPRRYREQTANTGVHDETSCARPRSLTTSGLAARDPLRSPCLPRLYSPTHKRHTPQISGTRAESQQIVAAWLLYCLQYPVRAKSSAGDLSSSMFACYMRGRGRAPRRVPPVVRLRAGAYWCRNREGSGLAASTDSGLEAF